ncbi:MAG: ion channel [Phycisphaerae bacterium]
MITMVQNPQVDLGKMMTGLMELLQKAEGIDLLSAKLGERPAQNTLIVLGAAAVLFYQAERGVNKKVKTIFDALEYCSSSLSVGYTSIYPQTAIGKLVATMLMTYGPALTGAMLEGPRRAAT